jgi:hypothetical protein
MGLSHRLETAAVIDGVAEPGRKLEGFLRLFSLRTSQAPNTGRLTFSEVHVGDGRNEALNFGKRDAEAGYWILKPLTPHA